MLLFLPGLILPGMATILDPFSHDTQALAALREINRELLVISTSNVNIRIQTEADTARQHILNAIYELDPLPDNEKRELIERPVASYRAAIQASLSKSDPITDPKLRQLDEDDLSKN